MQAIFLDLQDQFLSEQDIAAEAGAPDYILQGMTVFQLVPDETFRILIYRQLDVYVLESPAP